MGLAGNGNPDHRTAYSFCGVTSDDTKILSISRKYLLNYRSTIIQSPELGLNYNEFLNDQAL